MFERCQRADCDVIGWKTKKAFLKRRVWKLIKEFLTDCALIVFTRTETGKQSEKRTVCPLT